MVWTVITIHLLLSAGLLWLAWQLWLLRGAFVATVKAVDSWTIACQNGLAPAPAVILLARQGAQQVRTKYRAIVQQLSKIYGILQTVQRIYGRVRPRGRRNGKR
ncbi:MAG: hypothetical protein ACK4QL_00890 [Pseudanabaenaceae cyanobacterium]